MCQSPNPSPTHLHQKSSLCLPPLTLTIHLPPSHSYPKSGLAVARSIPTKILHSLSLPLESLAASPSFSPTKSCLSSTSSGLYFPSGPAQSSHQRPHEHSSLKKQQMRLPPSLPARFRVSSISESRRRHSDQRGSVGLNLSWTKGSRTRSCHCMRSCTGWR